MRSRSWLKMAVAALALVWIVHEVPAGEPMFVRWLVPGDPGDETIRSYWDLEKAGELSPEGRVDLGTMLFARGYPKDAVRLYRKALKDDPKLYEAWFRIGLVEHREGDLEAAEDAYLRCLKLLKGHGWCNFYLGLLYEQEGVVKRALDRYRRAFKVAPELADPETNPEVLYSELALGAIVRHHERERFTGAMPMAFLEPEAVAGVRARFEPTPTAPPAPTRRVAKARPQVEATPTPLVVRETPAATEAPDRAPAVVPRRPGREGRPGRTRVTPERLQELRERFRRRQLGGDGQPPPPPVEAPTPLPDVSPEASLRLPRGPQPATG